MPYQITHDTTVAEGTAAGTIVATVLAFDGDFASSNNGVIYSLADVTSTFKIDSDTGVITLIGELDYDTGLRSYDFTVLASDTGSPVLSTDELPIAISVSDINDNHPIFDVTDLETIRLTEATALDTLVATVRATDADPDENGKVEYSLVTKGVPFSLDSDTGELTLSGELDFESGNTRCV